MKYIIEFEDKPNFINDGTPYYKCKQAPWWSSSDTLIGRLTSAQDILSEIDKIDQKVDEAYQRGLQDGKDYYDQGCEGCKHEANWDPNAGICAMCSNSYKNRYERKDADDEIKVGDEVVTIDIDGEKVKGVFPWVVTSGNVDDGYYGIDCEGRIRGNSCVSKTGRHFDVEKLLEEMQT